MWFKKKREDNGSSFMLVRVTDVDDLKKEIEKLQESNKTLNDEFSKLQRIVKYSGSEPTYRLDSSTFFNMSASFSRKYTLYIYVDNEEYIIELSELKDENIDEEDCEFKIENNFAYFNISSSWIWNVAHDKWKRHEFIIDFKNGKYVCSSKYNEELNAKENVELIVE